MMHGCYWGMGWGMSVFPILIVIAAVYYFKNRSASDQPVEILKKRYAKGEITEEEFEKMKKNLGR